MSANTTVGEMLAVNGGQPVRETLLPYGRQAIDDDDIQAVVETLRSDWLTTGPKVEEFEEAFAARAGAKHAVSFSSGTAALHGAAFAANFRGHGKLCALSGCHARIRRCLSGYFDPRSRAGGFWSQLAHARNSPGRLCRPPL